MAVQMKKIPSASLNPTRKGLMGNLAAIIAARDAGGNVIL